MTLGIFCKTIGLWAQMPEWVLFHPRLSDHAVRAFGCLYISAIRNQSDDYAYVSYEEMGSWLIRQQDKKVADGKEVVWVPGSRSMAKRAVSELVEVGAIVSEGVWESGQQSANRYEISLVPPRGGVTGDPGVTGEPPRGVTGDPPFLLNRDLHIGDSAKAVASSSRSSWQQLIGVLAEAEGVVVAAASSSELGRIRRAAKLVRDACGGDAAAALELIPLAVERYRQSMPSHVPVTANGLAAHWSKITAQQSGASGWGAEKIWAAHDSGRPWKNPATGQMTRESPSAHGIPRPS